MLENFSRVWPGVFWGLWFPLRVFPLVVLQHLKYQMSLPCSLPPWGLLSLVVFAFFIKNFSFLTYLPSQTKTWDSLLNPPSLFPSHTILGHSAVIPFCCPPASLSDPGPRLPSANSYIFPLCFHSYKSLVKLPEMPFWETVLFIALFSGPMGSPHGCPLACHLGYTLREPRPLQLLLAVLFFCPHCLWLSCPVLLESSSPITLLPESSRFFLSRTSFIKMYSFFQ